MTEHILCNCGHYDSIPSEEIESVHDIPDLCQFCWNDLGDEEISIDLELWGEL